MKMPKIKQSEIVSRTFTIHGEPCAKANSRIMIFRNGKPRCVKNKASQDYVDNFIKESKLLNIPEFVGDVILHCTIFYKSYRKDLDESLIMDCLQKSGILRNDRQIKEKHIHHRISRESPCSVITLETKISVY